METVVLASGCFWCGEAAYKLISGVIEAVSGYCGGSKEDAVYDSVCSGTTDHAEAVKVVYDPEVIRLSGILDIFWTIHDPTTLNRQGNDVGPEYRSAIFYKDRAQKEIAQAAIKKVQQLWDRPVVTTLEKLNEFYPAENYHKDFYLRNSSSAYCQIIINPKLNKLRQQFANQLRKD